jgi:peptidyl-prolyl cis-trans isomerase B (cyclophilin B)
MNAVISAVMLWSVLFPSKQWYAPDQAVNVTVKPAGAVTLVLTDFTGKTIDAQGSADVDKEKTVDIKAIFPSMETGKTYILYAVAKGKTIADFEGTPLVIELRQDMRRGAAPGLNVICVRPLQYAVMSTDAGDMTLAFYYDVAPNTVDNFLKFAGEGYYDGLTFHRIVPGFVIQGGDPRGDGMGGPGYTIPAEFNERPHLEGVLSMARSMDPDSAGSQFFVCLDYQTTQQLDRQYTAFGKVTEGASVYKAIAETPLADKNAGKPAKAPVIKKVEVKGVTKDKNPYANLLKK